MQTDVISIKSRPSAESVYQSSTEVLDFPVVFNTKHIRDGQVVKYESGKAGIAKLKSMVSDTYCGRANTFYFETAGTLSYESRDGLIIINARKPVIWLLADFIRELK